jgi:NAD(P)-dependent dehydrogenase (short-subunit alcohol dehydrogenase family)
MNIFISGISSGIGYGLTRYYLEEGHAVWGISRRGFPTPHPRLVEGRIDLSDLDTLNTRLLSLPLPADGLDLVILNAGILGEIKDMQDSSVEDMKAVMDVNLWANVVLLKHLLAENYCRDMVIAISSGASVNGSRGWAGYSLSKAALNMMIKLFAAENPDLHMTAFAPGLVDTAMQDYICDLPTSENRPSVDTIQSARGTDRMPPPDTFAPQFETARCRLKEYPSGSFVDIRSMS